VSHEDIKIAFFMIVTDRDIMIADYSVRSYGKIRDVPFKLIIYSNWISSALKKRYFPLWREYPFVEIIEPEGQTDEAKPSDRRLWGPFELGCTIWDRELKKITSDYHATVDADFEILRPQFINHMLDRLDADPNLVAMASDYSPYNPQVYDSYVDEVISLNERWHTWFCIYKREALKSDVSHAYFSEMLPGSGTRSVWDDAGWLQKSLRERYGFELAAVGEEYQNCFIHYGQFGENQHVTEKNVALYRRVQILRKVGLFGSRDLIGRLIGRLLNRVLFRKFDRGHFVTGWAQGWREWTQTKDWPPCSKD
jgi:hypothetical protein